MSPPVSRCHFDFVNDRKVTASVGLHELTDMELASEGTAYETLMALSVYVMSTPLGGTWPRLIEMLGRHLFEFLLPDKEIRSQVVGMCANGRVHITLSFQPKAHRYAQLPWEFMSVPLGSDWRFLGKIGREVSITLTRHVPVQSSISTLTRPIKVLVDVTSPKDKTKVDSRLLEASSEDSRRRRTTISTSGSSTTGPRATSRLTWRIGDPTSTTGRATAPATRSGSQENRSTWSGSSPTGGASRR